MMGTFEGCPLSKKDISELALQTQLIYQRNARRFTDDRPKDLIEKSWIDQFRSLIPEGSKILDLGCGAGVPIASYLIRHGYSIVGLDASSNMIDMACDNIPSDLPPKAPSFITRVCGYGIHIPWFCFGQARRAWSPQIAQAHAPLPTMVC